MFGDACEGGHSEKTTTTMPCLWGGKGVACPLMVDSEGYITYKYNSTQDHIRRSFSTGVLGQGCMTKQVWQEGQIPAQGQVCCGPGMSAGQQAEQVAIRPMQRQGC
jgi:hypothetical protein